MRRGSYVGFYWTLPAPWAQFTALPEDVDEAAAASRTIRYQRERVRHWVKDEGGELVAEKVFLEIAPDRASPYIADVLKEAMTLCMGARASLVCVDFQERHGARPHPFLRDILHASGVETVLLPPDAIIVDGGTFDPIEHFRVWRTAWRAHVVGKPEHAQAVHQLVLTLRDEGASWPSVAERLNGDGWRTLNGKSWTGDNVRKFFAAHHSID